MKKLFLGAGLMLAVVAITFFSCNKEDIVNVDEQQLSISGNEFNIESNILVFNSEEDFYNTIDNIISMDDKELDTWENEKGFISIRSINNQILDELEFMETEEEVYELAMRYPEYCEIITNDEGEEELSLINDDMVYSAIANSKGYYVTGEKVNKVTSNYIIITDIDKADKIKEINNSNVDKIEKDKDITLYKYTQSKSDISGTKGCGHTRIEASVTYNKKGCRKDRKVKVEMLVVGYTYYNTYRIDTRITLKGYKKFACFWGRYTTYLEYKDVKGYVYTKDGNVWFNIGSGHGEVRKLEYEKNIALYTDGYQGSYYFDDVYAKASSRGVDTLWAIIDCPVGK